VTIIADGYEEFDETINVTSSRTSFEFTLSASKSQALENLVEDMVFVHGGSFKMGSEDSDSTAEYDEKPAHEVVLSSFYISRYEVTQELWHEVMGNNPSENLGDRMPVESVSWDDCQMFISKLNEITGLKFRLPTEAEWEYAARGGNASKGYKYAGSDSLDAVGWSLSIEGDAVLHEVGEKEPNELGLYDMSGNVQEWCSDWHAPYQKSLLKNPTGPKTGEYRITRGGHWETDGQHCTVSYRNPVPPDDVSHSLGLRLATKSIKSKRK